MSRTFHDGSRRVRVRGIRRHDPDLRKLARALIDLVQAEAEAEAQVQHRRHSANVVEIDAKRRAEAADPKKDAA